MILISSLSYKKSSIKIHVKISSILNSKVHIEVSIGYKKIKKLHMQPINTYNLPKSYHKNSVNVNFSTIPLKPSKQSYLQSNQVS